MTERVNRPYVYKQIDKERSYQDSRWGGFSHDTKHSTADWILFMERYLNRAKEALIDNGDKEALNQILKVTALGVACMEHKL